jgi:serine/threonine protein kinase
MTAPILETTGGHYRLLQRLAAGGCADIFLARTLDSTRHHEPYVIAKRLRPGEHPLLGSALQDEARLIARFDHPNIPRLLDLAEDPERPCLILECLHGEDLQQVLHETARRNRRVPYWAAVRIVADLAGALHHAHERTGPDGTPLQVVHRDVSPSNAVITYAGQVKLLDFGIARWRGVSQVTQIGIVKGKAPYMSPEQCLGRGVDRRSDLFSLGVLLYELTTMHTPFGSALGDEDAIMQRIVDGVYPAPDTLVPDYPAELAAIIARCLQTDRDRRYATGAEMYRDLLEVMACAGWVSTDADLDDWLRGLFGDRNPPWLHAPEEPEPEAPEVAVVPVVAAPAPAPVRRRRLLAISISFWLTIAVALLAYGVVVSLTIDPPVTSSGGSTAR